MSRKLRIAEMMISNWVNGPGKRLVIWFQGCPFRCKGCFNPEFWPFDGGEIIEVEKLIDMIKKLREKTKIEGVTYSGGEPLIQSEALLELSKGVKELGLTIVCYTGYNIEEIKAGKVKSGIELLKLFDILIDGLYIEEQKAPLIWRGSKNQRVWFLSDRYIYLKSLVDKKDAREVEINVGKGDIRITGIFDEIFWRKFYKKLKGE